MPILYLIAERPLGYERDLDYSLMIPDKGELKRSLPQDFSLKGSRKTRFAEHFAPGRSGAPDREPRIFDAVETAENLFFLWVEERVEWVGLQYSIESGSYEQNIYGGGCEEHITSHGPFKLNRECGRLIAEAYGSKNQDYDAVLRCSPSALNANA